MGAFSKLSLDFDNAEGSYLTHAIHAFPAKFPPQLPRRILEDFSSKGQTVLDPFTGSGTTLVEARLMGINAIGVDINGLACLLSMVKATPISSSDVQELRDFIESVEQIRFDWTLGTKKSAKVADFEGLTHWFQPNVAEEITVLIDKINGVENQNVRDFLRIVLSSIIVRVSNQESDTRFAAIKKGIMDSFTIGLFIEKSREYLKKLMEFSKAASKKSTVKVHNADARNLEFLDEESVDIIITSPPYANTYDYYLYHKFRKRWLGIDVHFAQYNEIGSRREFSSLKQNPQKWLDDLSQCFCEMGRVLKNNSLAFIVIGDSVINKKIIRMDEEIKKLCLNSPLKLAVRHIVSTSLSSHSKLFNPSFAQKGKKEHLIILEKTR